MESIYYVLAWHCHRRCKHCYDERFHPCRGVELARVIDEAIACSPRIIDNLPERLTYLDRTNLDGKGLPREKAGRIILSGGDVLTAPVREPVLYPALVRLRDRYRGQDVRIVVQTTGDLVTEKIVAELLARGMTNLSISGIDDYHVGIKGEDKQAALRDKLSRICDSFGMQRGGLSSEGKRPAGPKAPQYSFFGATPDAWIGKLWPRGRSWANDLSTATLVDNFCNRWSGGLKFLEHDYDGSEVSIEPNGDVYPCCMKTRLPIGNVAEEPLIEILDSLKGHPVYEAINRGAPERMGEAYGWSRETFLEKCRTVTPAGRPYENLCIGCDCFHEEVLGPLIAGAREARRARRMEVADA